MSSDEGTGKGKGAADALVAVTKQAKVNAVMERFKSSGDSDSPRSAAERWGVLRGIVRSAVIYRNSTFEYSTAGKLPMRVKLSYAAPMLAVTSLTMLISIHGTPFYSRIGLNASFLAFFTAIARSVDVITDPLMGWISDSTNSRFGRRRPYFVVGSVGYAIFYTLLFSPSKSFSPGPGETTSGSLIAWFGVFYILYYLFTTLSDVPHGALGPELTEDSEERNSLYFYYNLFRGVGVLIAAVAPVMVPYAVDGGVESCDVPKFCPPDAFADALPPSTFVPDPGMSCSSVPSASYLNSTACRSWSTEGESLSSPLACYCSCVDTQNSRCDLDSARTAFTVVAAAFGIYYVLSIWNCAYQIRERKASAGATNPPIVPSLLMTFRNKPFVGLLPAWVCDMTAITMLGTMMPYYMPYVIQPESVPECVDGTRSTLGLDSAGLSKSAMWCKWETWLGMSLVMLFVANLLSMPVWLYITKRFGKVRTWLFFNLTSALTNALFVFAGKGDPKLTTFLAAVNGVPAGAQFLTDSILADVIDYDEFLTGTRSEGRFTIFQGFIPKIVSIPAQAIPLALLAVVGFKEPDANGNLVKQEDVVSLYIQVVFYVVPFVLMLMSFWFKMKYPIKTQETINKIQEGVALHMKGQPAVDPLEGRTVTLFVFTKGSEKEEERMTWVYDHFFLSQLQLFVDTEAQEVKDPVVIVQRMRTLLAKTLAAFFLSLILVVVGVAVPTVDGATLINVPSLSWVPIFSVIGLGLGGGLSMFTYIRLRAARELHAAYLDGSLDKALILRWVDHLEGDDMSKAVNNQTGAGFTVSNLTSKVRKLTGSLTRGLSGDRKPADAVELTAAQDISPSAEDTTSGAEK